jgi:predicted adenylyl cyclase CyaB
MSANFRAPRSSGAWLRSTHQLIDKAHKTHMPRNIEIKASVDEPGALERAAAAVADHGPQRIEQDDTFFHCPEGRLKLRDFGNGQAELIFYRRPDQAGPKTSDYRITPTSEPDSLRETLGQALGTVGRVRKTRTLYLAGRTRIHLDQVEGLGHYMELEVVLGDGDEEAAGLAEAEALMTRLGIRRDQLIDRAYIDLLARKA